MKGRLGSRCLSSIFGTQSPGNVGSMMPVDIYNVLEGASQTSSRHHIVYFILFIPQITLEQWAKGPVQQRTVLDLSSWINRNKRVYWVYWQILNLEYTTFLVLLCHYLKHVLGNSTFTVWSLMFITHIPQDDDKSKERDNNGSIIEDFMTEAI